MKELGLSESAGIISSGQRAARLNVEKGRETDLGFHGGSSGSVTWADSLSCVLVISNYLLSALT